MTQTIPSVVGLAVVAMVIDLLWLSFNATRFSAIVQDMQGGRPLKMRLWAAIPVYVAIGYLVHRTDSAMSASKAFWTGLAAYVVYDFTQVATLDRYPVWFARTLPWWIPCGAESCYRSFGGLVTKSVGYSRRE